MSSDALGATPGPDLEELTPTSFVVLGLVALMGEATSYDLKQAVQASVGNFWSFPHSQLYAEPQRLAARGLLHEEQEAGGRRRRVFELTPEGHAALRAWLADPTTLPLELRDEGLLKLAFAAQADDADVAELARHQHQVQQRWIDHYDELAGMLAPTGDTRFTRATLEMGRRYRRLARQFWEDVETLADTGEMPVRDDPGS